MKCTEIEDARSREIFKKFEEALGVVLPQVAPDWLLHHMELRPHRDFETEEERVEIRLILKPLGSVKVVRDKPELQPPQLLIETKEQT